MRDRALFGHSFSHYTKSGTFGSGEYYSDICMRMPLGSARFLPYHLTFWVSAALWRSVLGSRFLNSNARVHLRHTYCSCSARGFQRKLDPPEPHPLLVVHGTPLCDPIVQRPIVKEISRVIVTAMDSMRVERPNPIGENRAWWIGKLAAARRICFCARARRWWGSSSSSGIEKASSSCKKLIGAAHFTWAIFTLLDFFLPCRNDPRWEDLPHFSKGKKERHIKSSWLIMASKGQGNDNICNAITRGRWLSTSLYIHTWEKNVYSISYMIRFAVINTHSTHSLKLI